LGTTVTRIAEQRFTVEPGRDLAQPQT
jgi:hypothetical protein